VRVDEGQRPAERLPRVGAGGRGDREAVLLGEFVDLGREEGEVLLVDLGLDPDGV
jgi:hypothetical protein